LTARYPTKNQMYMSTYLWIGTASALPVTNTNAFRTLHVRQNIHIVFWPIIL